MGCTTISKGIQASCAAVKKVGGVDKRIYIGNVNDLDSVTFGAAGVNSVTALTFKATKGLTRWIGRKDKNSAQNELEVGENVNLRNQTVNLVIYWETAEQLAVLDEILDNEGLFAIVETNAGTLECYGLNKINFDNYGLKPSAGSGNTGVVINDSTAFNLSLAGQHTNLQLLYNPAVALATNITALDTLSIDVIA